MKDHKLLNLVGLYLLIGLATAAVVGFFIIKPILNTAGKDGQQIADYNNKITALKQLDQDTQTLRQNYAAVKDQHDQILHLLPTANEEERLVAMVSDLTSKSSAVMTTFSPGGVAASAATGVATYPVNLAISASYAGVQSLLQKLENAARYIDVQSVNLAPNGAGSTNVQAAVNITAYYQAAPPASTTGGTQ